MKAEEWLDLPSSEMLAKWYRENYQPTTYGGLAGVGQSLAHQSLERGYTSDTYFDSVLEVGGNRGEHLRFLQHSFTTYLLTDLVPPILDEEVERMQDYKVKCLQADVEHLPFESDSMDRVVITCVLHHLPDPEMALSEIRRVLKPGGRADMLLPSDPGALYRLARFFGPASAARRMGLASVKTLVEARDHRNHVLGLRRLIHHVFRNDEIQSRTFPVRGLTWNTSLWATLRITKNAVEN